MLRNLGSYVLVTICYNYKFLQRGAYTKNLYYLYHIDYFIIHINMAYSRKWLIHMDLSRNFTLSSCQVVKCKVIENKAASPIYRVDCYN